MRHRPNNSMTSPPVHRSTGSPALRRTIGPWGLAIHPGTVGIALSTIHPTGGLSVRTCPFPSCAPRIFTGRGG